MNSRKRELLLPELTRKFQLSICGVTFCRAMVGQYQPPVGIVASLNVTHASTVMPVRGTMAGS
jgi:hypothetical protein